MTDLHHHYSNQVAPSTIETTTHDNLTTPSISDLQPPSSSTLTLTFVRHGESTDNLKSIWAGARDACLSNFGQAQAQRLGAFFKDIRFDLIYSSDLKRANSTATQIHIQNRAHSPSASTSPDTAASSSNGSLPSQTIESHAVRTDLSELIVDPLLREQNFGDQEGKPWNLERHNAKEFYSKRATKFKAGESLEDVHRRAKKFVEEVLFPRWSLLASSSDGGGVGSRTHICIVSHGIFLSELARVLHAIAGQPPPRHASLPNTGWTRFELHKTLTVPADAPQQLHPAIRLRTIATSQATHLAGLRRQPGGIGSAPYDPKQASLKSFLVAPISPKNLR